MLAAIGMEAFAERARREPIATGEKARKRTVDTVTTLTAQEAYIARLAREGRTNPEIGAQMYLSARTIGWHLRNVFAKLGISSRRELHTALAQLGQDTQLTWPRGPALFPLLAARGAGQGPDPGYCPGATQRKGP